MQSKMEEMMRLGMEEDSVSEKLMKQSASPKPITSTHVADRYASVGHGVIRLATRSKMEEMMCRGMKEDSVSEKLMKTYLASGKDTLTLPLPLPPPLRTHRSSN